MIEGAMCTIGLACAQWLGYGFFFFGDDPRQWRPVVALQCAPALLVFCLIMLLPESPRWLVKVNRMDEAHYVLARLADKPMDHPDVIEDLESIRASFESQKGAAPFHYRELFENGKTQTFRRICLGFFIQSAQQISGINMVATYANTIIASSFGFNSETSHLLAACVGTEYAICSCLSLLFIERVGRRKIFMITAAGMSASFIIISYVSC
jgi:MFS family permease